jgi:hypothetical protein
MLFMSNLTPRCGGGKGNNRRFFSMSVEKAFHHEGHEDHEDFFLCFSSCPSCASWLKWGTVKSRI